MTVSNVTPKVQYTGNGSTTEFGFTFVVPASLDPGTITDSTASISLGSTTLTVTTADLFYTSDLQGKTITITGAGAGSSTLTTTIVTVDSATQVTVADAASVTVSNADIVVTTGKTGTTMKNTAELEVYVDSTLQTYTTDYTVRLDVGDDLNKQGTVIFTTAPASSTTVTIARNIELSRTSDFQPGGALTAKELNAQFDNVVMAVQDQKNDDDRFIQFPADEPAGTSAVLPDATTRAGKFFVFDSSGDINVSNNINLPDADLTVDSITAANVNTTNSTITTGTITNLNSTTVNIDGGAIDSTTIGATTPQSGNFTTLDADNLDVSSVATINSADINGGTIDNTTIGATTPNTGSFTDLTVSGTLTNTGGNFVLGSVIASGSDGVTAQKLQGYLTNDLAITSNANVSITAGGGTNEYVVLDDKVSFSTDNSSITVSGRAHTGKLIQSPNSDIVIDAYKGGSAGKLVVVSDDGIHVDGVDPKIKGLLQLKLEDGAPANNILLSNSTDIDTAGIQLNQQQNTTIQLGQITFPPDLQAATDSIDVGMFPRLKYRKRVVISNSGQSFTYPSAALGDKLIKSGSSDDFGYVVEVVTGAQTTSSVTYVVLTNKQTWATTGPFIVVDGLGQTLQFTAASGTPGIGSQNNDSGFFIGYDHALAGLTTSDLPEGSNLYYTDARVVSKLNASSIDEFLDVAKGTPSQGDVLTFSGSTFQPVAPTTAPVTSVNSQTGAVSLGTDDIAQGSTNLYYAQSLFDSSFATKTTDNLAEGITNVYYTAERVDDRVNQLLTAGTGISLSYNDPANTLTITNTNVGLTDVVDDTTPQLGGGLDVNGNNIYSLSNADIKIQPNGTGAVLVGSNNTNAEISTNGTGDLLLRTNGSTTTAAANSSQIKIVDGTDGDIEITPHGDGQIDLDSYVWPKNGLGAVDQFLKINSVSGGVAQLAWTSPTFTNDLVNDTTPQLGGDLDVNGRAIVTVGNGNINLQPDASGTGVVLIDGIQWPTDNGTNGQFLQTNGSGTSDWATVPINVVEDTTPQLGGDLDVNGNDIVSVSNGDITIEPDGTGDIKLQKDVLIQGGATDGRYLVVDNFDGATPVTFGYNSPGITIASKGTGDNRDFPGMILHNSSSSSGAYPSIWIQRNKNDDPGTTGYLADNERVFAFYGSADRGGFYYNQMAGIEYRSSEAHSASAQGGKIEFYTMPNGTNSYGGQTKKLTIDEHVTMNSLLELKAYASGSLPTGVNGAIIAISDNSHKPAYYDGTSWKYISDNSAV